MTDTKTDCDMNTAISCSFSFRTRAVTGSTDQSFNPSRPGNVPRVSRLMALAIRFDRLLREGIVDDYAEIASLGFVSKARVSQIMSFLNLCPKIIDYLLRLSATTQGRDLITERDMRPICAEILWETQIKLFERVIPEKSLPDYQD